MDDTSKQWISMGEPATPEEAQALRAFRKLLADTPTTWAWSNLTFRSPDGRASEVDVVLLNRNGLFLIELKGWHGTITGDQQQWRITAPTGTMSGRRNPTLTTNAKAKRLASLLEQKAGRTNRQLPFVQEIVLLHGRDSVVKLDDTARAQTYGLDGYDVHGVPPITDLLKARAKQARDVIDATQAQWLVGLMGKAGFVARPRTIMVGQYALNDDDPVAEGPTWQDRLATHPVVKGQRQRIRLYDFPPEASPTQRAEIERAAKREYLLTQGLGHPGVVTPIEILLTERGPALVFPNDGDDVRLDEYLTQHNGTLDLDSRLELIRKIAEIVAYAHRNRVQHRGLNPARIWVTRGPAPRIRIRDWQTGYQQAGESMSATRQSILAGATRLAELIEQEQLVYLAPEALSPAATPDPVALDVYGLGAVAYLILAGGPPATNLAELQQHLQTGGLDPAVLRDEIPAPLSDLVRHATDPNTADRTPDVDSFLTQLTQAEKQPEDDTPPEETVDPLEAQPGDILGNDLLVEERLGSGATGLALLVSTGDKEAVPTVYKIAHDGTRAQRLIAEAELLARLDHPRILQLLSGPAELGGRIYIEVADAGRPTLGARIHEEGRLTIEQLQNYGRDLFEAVAYLESQGVLHRDIKPDNLGVRADRGDRKPRLVLFDFSLANEPADRVQSGTRGYLDPFLGTRDRPRYDSAAERFAVAVTLFQMATAQLPEWGDGTADPASISDDVTLVDSWFEDQVAQSMIDFFGRALARDSAQRFDDLREMATAWDAIFTSLGATAHEGADTTVDEHTRADAAARATTATALHDAGLSARALSALNRVGVATVGELLALPAVRINQLPGVGVAVRREIQRRHREWRDRLLTPTTTEQGDVFGRAVELAAASLVPRPNGRNANAVALARTLLTPTDDAPLWPTWQNLADRAHLSTADLAGAQQQLLRFWMASDTATELRVELLAMLQSLEGLMTVPEAADRLVALRGSRASGGQRTRNAAAMVWVALEAAQADSAELTANRGSQDEPVVLSQGSTDEEDPAPRVAAVRALADLVSAAAEEAGAPLKPIRSLALVTESTTSEGSGITDPSRLLALAASASGEAAVSSRGELYPSGMAPAASVKAVLAGRVGQHLVSPDWLRRTVAVRFPHASPVPDRPDLDPLVAAAVPELAWDGTRYVRTGTASGTVLRTGTVFASHAPVGSSVFEAVDQRLRQSLEARTCVVMGVDPRHALQAPHELAQRYGLRPVNVTTELLAAMKAFAANKSVSWGMLLDVDAQDPDTPDRQRLERLVAQALDPLWERWLQSSEALVLGEVAPLARYGQLARVEQLVSLTTPRPAARWIVVPHYASDGPPMLEGLPMPTGPEGWVDLPVEVLVTSKAS